MNVQTRLISLFKDKDPLFDEEFKIVSKFNKVYVSESIIDDFLGKYEYQSFFITCENFISFLRGNIFNLFDGYYNDEKIQGFVTESRGDYRDKLIDDITNN